METREIQHVKNGVVHYEQNPTVLTQRNDWKIMTKNSCRVIAKIVAVTTVLSLFMQGFVTIENTSADFYKREYTHNPLSLFLVILNIFSVVIAVSLEGGKTIPLPGSYIDD